MENEKVAALSEERAETGSQPEQAPEVDADRIQLLTRLLVGVLIVGGDELLKRLDGLQEEILADPGLVRRKTSTQAYIPGDRLRHLAIGLLMRGQRRVTSGLRSGYNLSLGTTRWVFGTLDRLTDNRLTRPLRRPIAARTRNWEQEAILLIEEGSLEEERSKVLTVEALGVIIDEVVGYAADNPELDRLVAELVGQKSAKLATIMADNTRSLTATGDDLAEGLLRRLFKRTPRRLLPPSPIEGKPQTMYRPETRVEGGNTNGE